MAKGASGKNTRPPSFTVLEEKVLSLIGITCVQGIISASKGDTAYRQIQVRIFQFILIMLFTFLNFFNASKVSAY